jgi:hypothetical protein
MSPLRARSRARRRAPLGTSGSSRAPRRGGPSDRARACAASEDVPATDAGRSASRAPRRRRLGVRARARPRSAVRPRQGEAPRAARSRAWRTAANSTSAGPRHSASASASRSAAFSGSPCRSAARPSATARSKRTRSSSSSRTSSTVMPAARPAMVRNWPAAAVDTCRSLAATARTGDIAISAAWLANRHQKSVKLTAR